MCFGRKKDRQRVEWLVRFLEAWCTEEELEERAVNFIDNMKNDIQVSVLLWNEEFSLSYVDKIVLKYMEKTKKQLIKKLF